MTAETRQKRGVSPAARRRLDDHEWLWSQYIERGRTNRSIADELGVDPSVVTSALAVAEARRVDAAGDRTPLGLLWLEECLAAGKGVEEMAAEAHTDAEEIRKHLRHWQFEGRLDSYRYLLDPEWLQQEYRASGRTMEDIARQLGVNVITVTKYIRRAGLVVIDVNKARHVAAPEAWPSQLRDAEWLSTQYLTRRQSVTVIAQELGTTENLVLAALDRAGIQRRAGLAKWHPEDVRKLLADRDALAVKLRNYRDAQVLAGELGIGATTLHRWMRRHGLLANRERHPDAAFQPGGTASGKLDDPAWLRTAYVDRAQTKADIAAEVNVAPERVAAALRTHGISRPPVRYPQLADRAWLADAAARCASLREIATELGCTTAAVSRAFDRLKVQKPARNQSLRYPQLHDREWLQQAAERLGSLSAIAAEVGCSSPNVALAFDREGLPRPVPKPKVDRPQQLDDPVWLREAYIEQGRSQADIAVELNASRSAVRSALRRHGVRRGPQEAG